MPTHFHVVAGDQGQGSLGLAIAPPPTPCAFKRAGELSMFVFAANGWFQRRRTRMQMQILLCFCVSQQGYQGLNFIPGM